MVLEAQYKEEAKAAAAVAGASVWGGEPSRDAYASPSLFGE